MAQIVLNELKKTFVLDNTTFSAVESVSLEIEKGEFLSIIGHSGSGKTTLLSMLGGILSPSSGQILFEGIDIYKLNEDELSAYRAARVGYMFQFASLMPVLTARENLLLPTLFKGDGDSSKKDARAIELLDMVGLADKASAYPAQLSGGQQRRVAIARAMMNDPELILADEPTGDLDEETEADVMALFHKINKEQNVTFMLVTHSSELASEATRRFRMERGVLALA
jgi:ABC-type lipoprotein export system ATPase subunit